MNRFLFVDTSAWIANFVAEDQHHQEARRFVSESLQSRPGLLTSDYVFDELITRLRYQVNHREAVRVGEAILSAPRLTLVEVNGALRDQGWRLFKRFSDQKLSFTDCTSVAIMESLGLKEVFTFDQDFERLGFLTLPGLS